jgi:6-phosphogluconolactonase
VGKLEHFITMKSLNVFQTVDEFNKAAIEYIISIANKSIADSGRFTIVLSGGETPAKIYSLLAEPPFSNQISWEKTFVFWGDERCVPFDSERNNAHNAIVLLLKKVSVPTSNIFRIPVDLVPIEAAAKYQKTINNFFEVESPKFDLILLGLGENGHTASLFPGTEVVNEHGIGVREVYVKEENTFRITMTAPLINSAYHILFLVTGEKKAVILKKVLAGSYQPDKYPAQLIKPTDGELVWFVDSSAALLMNV